METKCLITKTLIHNASIIIDNPDEFTLDRFFDFSSLCEAVILFDKLEAIESSNFLYNSSLPIQLIKSNILSEFTPVYNRTKTRELINKLPNFLNDFSIETLWEQGIEPKLDDKKATNLWDRDDYRPTENYSSIDFVPISEIFNYNDNLELDKQLNWITDLKYYPSLPPKAVEARYYILRTMGYLFVSLINKIDYYPDFVRIPNITSYSYKIHKSLSPELYHKIANIFKQDINLINESCRSFTVPIPPLTALVLKNAGSINEIPNSLIGVRESFSKFRRTIGELEEILKTVKSPKEKLKIINYKKALFDEISKKYEKNENFTYKDVLNYTEKLVKPVTSPLNPTSYSAALITQPVEWLKSWWLSRPIIPLFRIDSKVRNITDYQHLIKKIWGKEIHDETIARYINHSNSIEKIFSSF